LGDFYSVEYVELWRTLLQRHPALHVFGMTARCDTGDPIAAALVALVHDYLVRFCLRFSNAPQPFGSFDHLNRASVSEAKRCDYLPRANRPDGIL
jgi:hypothetical protein